MHAQMQQRTEQRMQLLPRMLQSIEVLQLPTQDLSVWRHSIDTLVHGPFHCANAVAPHMLDQGRGVIIGIGDLSAYEPWPGFAGHAVGKSAILALTRQLGIEAIIEFAGRMHPAEFLRRSDIMLLTSISEGLPFAILPDRS